MLNFPDFKSAPVASRMLSQPFLPLEWMLQPSDLPDLNALKTYLLERVEPQGDAALRSAIANDLRQRQGLDCKADWIVITTGAQQAIDGLMRAHTPTQVVVEEPGYHFAYACARQAGHELVTLPYTHALVIDWLQWESRLKRLRPDSIIYLVPRFSNPLGRSFSVEELARFEHLIAAHRGPVIVDGWMDELHFQNSVTKPALSRPFIYLGSMTKKMFPGVRVGYAVIEDKALRDVLIAHKRIASGSGALYAEKIVCHLLESGLWERHVSKLRARLAIQFSWLKESLKTVAQVPDVEGGILCWVQPHREIKAEALNHELMKHGACIRLPSQAMPSHSDTSVPPGFGLSFTQVSPADLELIYQYFIRTTSETCSIGQS